MCYYLLEESKESEVLIVPVNMHEFMEIWRETFTTCYSTALQAGNLDLAAHCKKFLDCPVGEEMNREELLETIRECKTLLLLYDAPVTNVN